MNKLLNLQRAKFIAISVAISFLLIHIVLFVLFNLCHVTPMAVFNIFSITFYVLTVVMVLREKLRLFVVSVYLEVVIHMTLSVYFVGWDSGFQITLICMNVMLFFSEYVGRSLGLKVVNSLPLSLLGSFAFLGIYVVVRFHTPAYTLIDPFPFWLTLTWGIIVFFISTTILYLFVLFSFQSETVLSEQATKDRLTGLPNRYFMSEYLASLFRDENPVEYWLAMADIDDFKHINDTYGHNFGDYVLCEMASILQGSLPEAQVCRWGGEEFLLVGKLGNGLKDPVQILESLIMDIAKREFTYNGNTINLTITIGISPYVQGQTVEEWINLADKKLYVGKVSGKNQVVS